MHLLASIKTFKFSNAESWLAAENSDEHEPIIPPVSLHGIMGVMPVKKFLEILKSPRALASLVTLVVLALIVILSWHELTRAWQLLGQANLGLLLLLVPFQIIVYYAGGEMIFAYLRDKKDIHHVSRFEQTRIALELNLVNHIFPSGGVSGISYTTWRMHKLGVSSARSTFAQVVRYVTGFLALVILLVIAVIFLAIDGQVNRYIVASSFILVFTVLALTFGLIFMFSSKRRMHVVASRLTRLINWCVRWATAGRKKRLLNAERVEAFFTDMHDDFHDMSSNPKLLSKPAVWGMVYTIFDVAMFAVAFMALGTFVNPAILMVGYGVAGLVSLVAFTPGGAGVHEVIMIFFLSMAGVRPDLAIAGIVLTRAILLTGTILFGYIFYQHALLKYGKRSDAKV